MMQSAYLRKRDDRTIGNVLPASVLRSIAIQSHVAAGSVVYTHPSDDEMSSRLRDLAC